MRAVSKDFGEELRRRRVAAGFSLHDLSVKVHYSRGHLSKVENSQVAPSAHLARLADAALDARGQLIAFVTAQITGDFSIDQGAGETWTTVLDPESGSWFAPVDARRTPVAGSGSLIGFADSGLSDIRPGHSDSVLRAFRAMFAQTRAWSRMMDVRILLPGLWGQTHSLRQLARAAGPARGPALYVLAARHAELAGWMAQETGDDRAALWWTHQAVRLAETGGDHSMGAYAYVRRALVALYRGDANQTVELARYARQHAYASASLKGLAALREAQGLALAGDGIECQHSLDQADRYLEDTGTPEVELPALGLTTLANHVAMTAAWCWYDLGQPARSARLLGREIARIPAHARRARARFTARQALAHAAARELDQACAVTRALLPDAQDLGSATINHDLRQLARTLRRWSSQRSVLDVQPELDHLLRAQTRLAGPKELAWL
jgi:hypothetical protein